MAIHSVELSEKELKEAIAYWVEQGMPKARHVSVVLRYDRTTNTNQFDYGTGHTATVTVSNVAGQKP